MAIRHGGFHAQWKTLSGSECVVEDAVGNVEVLGDFWSPKFGFETRGMRAMWLV